MSYCENLPHLGASFEESREAIREHIRGEHGCRSCRHRAQQATAAEVGRRLKKAYGDERLLSALLAQFANHQLALNDDISEIGIFKLHLDQDDAIRREPSLRDRRKSNGAIRNGNGGHHVAVAAGGK